jgi:hypothetical protein
VVKGEDFKDAKSAKSAKKIEFYFGGLKVAGTLQVVLGVICG